MIQRTSKSVANWRAAIKLFIGPPESMTRAVDKRIWCIDKFRELNESNVLHTMRSDRKMQLVYLAIRHNNVAVIDEFRNWMKIDAPIPSSPEFIHLTSNCDKYSASDEMIQALIRQFRFENWMSFVYSSRFHKVTASNGFALMQCEQRSVDIVFDSGDIDLISRLVTESIPDDGAHDGQLTRFKLTACLAQSLSRPNLVFNVVWNHFTATSNVVWREHKCVVPISSKVNSRSLATMIAHPICQDKLEIDLSGLFISSSDEEALANKWVLIQLSILGVNLKSMIVFDDTQHVDDESPLVDMIRAIDDAQSNRLQMHKLVTDILGKDLAGLVVSYLA